MPGFDYKFLEKPKRRFQCPLCIKTMREPVQVSTCGHRFCDTCLQEFLSEGVFKCPEDQLPLDYAKIYPDPELEQQILALNIRCIHSEEGCRWTGQVKQLQGHFSTCSYNVIPCPNRCATKLTRRELPAHLQHDCTKRQVRCEHCGDDFTGAAYEEHQGVCPQESVYCENKCGARLARRLLGRHGATECPKRTLPCRHCGKGFVWDTLQNHQYQCPQFLVSCPHQCGAVSLTREELTAHVRDGCNTSQGPKVAMSRHLEDMAKAHLNLMCGMVNRQRQEILELRREVEEMSAGRCGAFLWKVADYTRQFQEARRHSNSECLSPTFCSHRYGYRLQASAFLDGNGSGEGSFLSLYIRVLPGEYDNLLEWPFPGRVTFSLLDQSDPSFSKPQHIIETFNPDPSWKNFQRPRAGRPTCDPTDESALGFGYPKFISHEEIRKRNYIRDDAIFLKVSVDIPQKIIA
ncbi:TNF receptor-associated factor 4-like isoform X2 [Paramormyrops kingsleyae]|uniref:TNF receptor-associated factor 4-like isoform X2 n=1 Tax=Paramormyrops kingsleyae TaxID=1676925 RepID=UPI000CD5CCA9|nr:TNF receptor-associated factor 4-like isoform X2 [Paramormyrops kingsleyae]